MLDVGCNSGMVTIEVAQRLGAGKVVGVDVDKELVKSAKGNGAFAPLFLSGAKLKGLTLL